MRQAPIALPEASDQRLECAILTLMPELDPGRVEGNRVGRELLRGGEDKLRFRVDEPLDEPGRSDAVDVGARTRDPAAAPEGVHGKIGLRGSAGLARMQSHLDGLLEPLRFVVAGRIKKVDLTDALQFPGESRQLLAAARGAVGRRLSVKSTSHLAVSLHENPV